MAKIADEYKSCNELKNVEKVTGEMEDIEEITTEVAERAQAYLDSRRDEELSARKIISKNWGQKTKAEDLQSARYQGDLKVVMDRYDQRKVTEGEKLWSKSSSGKIDRKMMLIKKANQLRWMISKGLWKQLKRVSIPIFDANKKKFVITGKQHSWHVLIKLQLQQNTGFYNYASNFQVLKALKATENLGHSAAVYRIAKKH